MIFALPLGRLRIRESGGPGGHNGLESVIVSFGSEDIPRLRLGIGDAPERARSITCFAVLREEKPK